MQARGAEQEHSLVLAAGAVARLHGSISRRPGVSKWQAVRNVVVGGLGTGMFSLPWAMAGASIIPGVAVTLVVVAVNMWTIMILVEGAEIHQVFDLGGLLRKLPGRLGVFMQIFTNAVVWVALMGSLFSYLISIHDCVRPLVHGTFLDHRLPIIAAATLLVLPLCFLDQRYLSCTSLVALIMNAYLFAIICSLLWQKIVDHSLPAGSCSLGFASGGVTMISSMMQCIIIQMCVLPMYKELEDRSPRQFLWVLVVSFCSLGIFFCIFAVVGYVVFGPDVQPNIISALPRSAVADVARIGMVAVVAAVYPIMVIPMVAPVQNLSLEWFSKGVVVDDIAVRRRKFLVSLTTVLIVAVSFLGGWWIDSLAVINVIDGAMCVGVFTALGPALTGLYLIEKKSLPWKLAMCSLLVVGVLMSVAGFYFNENHPSQLAENCIHSAVD